MSRIHVEAERLVDAKPQDVYAFITDYRDKRPHILPPNYSDYAVVKGGRGNGTVIRYRFQAARRQRIYEMMVEEPSRGRVLLERDATSSLVTTWTVTPTASKNQTRVAISTEWEGSRGIGGFFERAFAPAGLRRVYNDVLDRLEQALVPSKTATSQVAS